MTDPDHAIIPGGIRDRALRALAPGQTAERREMQKLAKAALAEAAQRIIICYVCICYLLGAMPLPRPPNHYQKWFRHT
jgi:hypothetical protein